MRWYRIGYATTLLFNTKPHIAACVRAGEHLLVK